MPAFVFAAVNQPDGFADGGFAESGGEHFGDAHIFFDIGFENRVEHIIRRERVAVFLVGPQFGGRRALNGGRRNDDALLVAPAAEIEYQRFRNVFDDGEAAGHIAVERAVAGGELALVAGGEHQPAELVRERHNQCAADARLEIFFGQIRLGVMPDFGQRAGEFFIHRENRNRVELDAEIGGDQSGVGKRFVRRILRRHGDGGHAVFAERVNRQRQYQCGVDSAADCDDGFLEAVLVHVIAQAEPERFVDFFDWV